MRTANHIWIGADPGRVFDLAEAVELWPDILPHYRYVRRLSVLPHGRIVEMAARRDFIPIKWTSILEPQREHLRLRFLHIGGVTKGMDVEWRLTPSGSGTHVTIAHDLVLTWPSPLKRLGELVIGRYFIHSVAGRTLRRMKQVAEAQPERTPVSL